MYKITSQTKSARQTSSLTLLWDVSNGAGRIVSAWVGSTSGGDVKTAAWVVAWRLKYKYRWEPGIESNQKQTLLLYLEWN